MNLKKKFVVGAASVALIAGMGVTPAFAADVHLPNGTQVVRLSGEDRTATSVAVAEKRMKDSPVTTAYIVGYNAVVDAAAAGALTDGVILVAPKDKSGQLLLGNTMLNSAQLSQVTKLVAVGGEGVVPKSVLDNIKKFDTKITSTDRIDGKNRYETSVAIAKKAFATSTATNIYLARGDNPVDAMAAGAILGGPVVLVNPSGTVDPSVPAYYKASGVKADNVIVLGGEGALADAQVQQVVGQHETVSPWEFAASEADLKKAIQKAAIAYLGHDAWQDTATDLQPDPEKPNYGLFGLADTVNDVAGTLQDPRLIEVPSAALTAGDAAKAFTGYKTTYDILNKNVVGINGAYNVKKATLDKELADAIAAGSKFTLGQSQGAAATAPTLTALDEAVKAMYGIAAVAPTATTKGTNDGNFVATGVTLTNADATPYAFNEKGELTGLNQAWVNKFNKAATDAAGTGVVSVAGTYVESTVPKGVAGSLNAIIADKAADGKSATDAADADKQRINWFVLNELANKQLATQKALTDSAKADLAAAVAKYQTRPWEKVVTQAKGVKRIIGADRYETSALISYYATTKTGTPTTEVYLASGADNNLIDSVVAGQLTKGSIMLVPTKPELTEQTGLELKRLAKVNATINGFVIGGTAAVSDDTLKAVAAAMK
ncbi:MAG: cell wall-binding repeat-containing protein [Mobiluncus sp.]|uniref:cell wall-binding repeat-containing protein n=1 Tax=Mobiluncus sp. TaxID=47293 RepID=UPI002586B334|nr:cell wall-binding repeat-containing protein [Mobiluncus sp.]MCI6584077.1 cell wall-binding repeat-containing protein [Mobiluncus sp.]